MTPPGHFAVSYLIGKLHPRIVLPAILIGGVLPDIDFLLVPFPWFNQVHRVITHNLLFVGIVACVSLFINTPMPKYRIALGLMLGGMLHLFVDSCLDSNASNGIGVALFWPFHEGFFSPFNLFQPGESQVGWDQPFVFIMSSFSKLWVEIPVYLLLFGVMLRIRKGNGTGNTTAVNIYKNLV
jgi:membrane-bound metal-dependent hydrolase YbcI (DUF457 family)